MKLVESEVALFLSDGTFFRLATVPFCVTVQLWEKRPFGFDDRLFDRWGEDVGGVSYVERPS